MTIADDTPRSRGSPERDMDEMPKYRLRTYDAPNTTDLFSLSVFYI